VVNLDEELKFITDGMLGKLTRWLRILGYDVEYRPDEADDKLIELAKKTGRTLLTSDLQLYRKATKMGVNTFLVDGKSDVENLAKTSKRFNLNIRTEEIEETRCPVCNSKLRLALPSEVEGKIPTITLKTYKEFWICTNPKCQKIYWQGSHWKKIEEILKEVKKLTG